MKTFVPLMLFILAVGTLPAFAGANPSEMIAAVASSEGLNQITQILSERAGSAAFGKFLKDDLGISNENVLRARRDPEFAQELLETHLRAEGSNPELVAKVSHVLRSDFHFDQVIASVKATKTTGTTAATGTGQQKFSLVREKSTVTTATAAVGPNNTASGRIASIEAKFGSLPGVDAARVTELKAALEAPGSQEESLVGPGIFEKCGGFDPEANNTLLDVYDAGGHALAKGQSAKEAEIEVLMEEGSATTREEAERDACELATECHLTAGALAAGCATSVAAQ